MAYCRGGADSDVYVIRHIDPPHNYITYVAGGSDLSFSASSLLELKERLLALRSEGYKVPEYVFTRINQEMKNDTLSCNDASKRIEY